MSSCQTPRVSTTSRVAKLALFLMVSAAAGGGPTPLAMARAPGRDDANRVAVENARTDGVVPRTRWDRQAFLADPGIGTVEGFTTEFSVAPGDTVHFKVKTPAGSRSYRYEIYRLGWYGGNGARQVWPVCDVVAPAPCPRLTISDNPVQGPCDRFAAGDPGLDVADCTNWQVS